MINTTLFRKLFEELADNFDFGLDLEKKSDKNYLPRLFSFFEYENLEISDHDLKSAIYDLIAKTTKEEWNKKFGYYGKPAIADWLSFLGKRAVSPEQMSVIELSAVKQVAKNLNEDQYFLFENGTTNAVIEDFGGLRKIQLIILSDVDISFFDNKFTKTWLAFFLAKKESKILSGYPKKFINQYKNSKDIVYDRCEKCHQYYCKYDHMEKDNEIILVKNRFAAKKAPNFLGRSATAKA